MKLIAPIELGPESGQAIGMLPTKQEREYAESYIRRAMQILGLSEWVLFVSYKKTKKFRAEINVVEGSRVAYLTLARPFWEGSDEMKLWTIAHELTHIHTSEMCQAVEGCFKPHVSESNWESTHYAFHISEERCVDHLAKVLMKLLPAWDPPNATNSEEKAEPRKRRAGKARS